MRVSTRLMCICLAALLLGIPMAQSYAADDEKPSIFINSGSFFGFVLGTNNGLVRFSQLARARGFRIDHGVHPDLTSGSPLDGIDVYILIEPNFPFVAKDRVALRQWIRNGGILITADIFLGRMGGFAEEFGFEFGQVQSGKHSLILPDNSPLAGPLNITSLSTFTNHPVTILDSSKAEVVLKFADGKAAMVRTISHAGKGEIIGIGALLVPFDDDVGGDIELADNEKLILNMFSYIKNKLSGSSGDGYDLNLLKLKTKGGSTFLPGDEIKFVARIKNIGALESEEMRIAFYVNRAGVGKVARIEVATATVSAVNAKKKSKIVKKTFLPDDLAPGTYEVTAEIDPDRLTGDANIGNNGATAKKKIIIE